MPKMDEGDLSKIRASLVCEQSLASFAEKLELGDKLLLGKGEDATGGRKRFSILSDAFEAVLAAIYLDSDLEAARDWLLNLMMPALKLGIEGNIPRLQNHSSGTGSKKRRQGILQDNFRDRPRP